VPKDGEKNCLSLSSKQAKPFLRSNNKRFYRWGEKGLRNFGLIFSSKLKRISEAKISTLIKNKTIVQRITQCFFFIPGKL
jgi:hypothetical protein